MDCLSFEEDKKKDINQTSILNNTTENIISLKKGNDSSILKELREPLNSTDNAIRLVNSRKLREQKKKSNGGNINNNNNNNNNNFNITRENNKSNGGNLSEIIIKNNNYLNKNSHRVLSSLVFNNNMQHNITNINNNFDFKSHANSIRMNYINSGINKNKMNKNKNGNNAYSKNKVNNTKKNENILTEINNEIKYSKTPYSLNSKLKALKRMQRPPLRQTTIMSKESLDKQNTQVDTIINKSNTNYQSSFVNYNNNNGKYSNSFVQNYQIEKEKNSLIDKINKNETLDMKIIETLYENKEINEKTLPELITYLAGIENKMNQEIQKVKDKYLPSINDYKKSIKFLKQNPHLKNLKEYKNFDEFKNKIRCQTSSNLDSENKESTSIYILNKIKISNYQSNNIKELNAIAHEKNIVQRRLGHQSFV
jgi:hypothetical protein